MIGAFISILLVCGNILVFLASAKIKRKEFPDEIFEGELGYEVDFHHAATLIECISLLFAVISIRLVIDKGFYWNGLFALFSVLVQVALSLIILYFFKNFSEDKKEKIQGYISILHLAIIAILSIVAIHTR